MKNKIIYFSDYEKAMVFSISYFHDKNKKPDKIQYCLGYSKEKNECDPEGTNDEING